MSKGSRKDKNAVQHVPSVISEPYVGTNGQGRGGGALRDIIHDVQGRPTKINHSSRRLSNG